MGKKQSFLTKAVIPAAGLGTRMRRISPSLPKELVPVAGKPLLKHVLEEASASNITDVALIISSSKESLRRELGSTFLEMNIHYFYQDTPRGLMDAVSLARDFIGKDPFALLLPDNLFIGSPASLAQISPSFFETGLDTISLTEVTRVQANRFPNSGYVTLRHESGPRYHVSSTGEKDSGSFQIMGKDTALRMFPRYICRPHLFDLIDALKPPAGQEIDDIPIWQGLASSGRLQGVLLKGEGFDAGSPAGYKILKEWAENHLI